MTVELIAIGMTVLLHFAGAAVLVWALLDGEQVDWSWLRPGPDDDDDGGRGPGEGPPEPPARDGGSGLPLPVTSPSPVRLREPGRLADRHPMPARRPAHAPEEPQRAPAPDGR